MRVIMKSIQILVMVVFLLLMAAWVQAQTNTLKFTATKATDERAIQLRWQSKTNAVYRLEYATQLSDSIAWDTLVDYFPSQGTNTVFLDTGKYWTEPALPHPKDDTQRYYRIVQIDTNTLVPPIVTVTNLTSGTNLSGEVEIDVHVETTNSIASVSFFVDGEEVETASADDSGNASYVINTTEWPNGSHTIFAVAETSAGTATTGEFQSTEQSGGGASASVPVTFDNYISKWNFSLPGFDASLGETQRITAEFISYSTWTLQIVDESQTTVRNASGSGYTMAFDWEGNDDNGSPTADGTYDFVLTASQATPPQNFSANMATAASANIASPTQWLAASSDGNSIVPLALYPPGMAEALGLTVFEGSLSDFMPERPAVSRMTSLAVSSGSMGSPVPMFSGTTQTTQRPHRPPPKPIKGTPGRLGVVWQGDHPDPGTNGGLAGFNPPANMAGSQRIGTIQLNPAYALPYGPIQNAGKIANGFEKTMAKYKWKTAFNYSNDQVSASLLRKPSKGGSSLFNYCNIGLLIGHGIHGDTQDFATSTPSLQSYMPIYRTGTAGYDWVRLCEFDFGGGPGGLRWMGIYACNILFFANATDMYDKGVLPMNPNLHALLAAETSVFMYPEYGRLWANYMNGVEDGVKHTVIDSWNLASRKAHIATNAVPQGYSLPVIMTTAYWPDCVNDKLLYYTENGSTDPSDILFRRVQVWPTYQVIQ
jgi:hypothetical protein